MEESVKQQAISKMKSVFERCLKIEGGKNAVNYTLTEILESLKLGTITQSALSDYVYYCSNALERAIVEISVEYTEEAFAEIIVPIANEVTESVLKATNMCFETTMSSAGYQLTAADYNQNIWKSSMTTRKNLFDVYNTSRKEAEKKVSSEQVAAEVSTNVRRASDNQTRGNLKRVSSAGVDAWISRRTMGGANTCAFCSQWNGKKLNYKQDVLEAKNYDIFWRHGYCRCIIEYNAGSGASTTTVDNYYIG